MIGALDLLESAIGEADNTIVRKVKEQNETVRDRRERERG